MILELNKEVKADWGRDCFQKADVTKGQHGSSKLHRISKKLPAATLATLGKGAKSLRQ